MKKAIFFIISIFVASNLFAQNNGFNYKALIANNGSVLVSQSVNIRFTILENATTSVYQETQSATTDTNGIVSVNIGEGTAVTGNFSVIDWDETAHFLKVEIDTGSGYVDFGTTEFKYVPYAKYAQKALIADYVNYSFWQQNSNGINSLDRVGIGRPVSVEANLHINDITSGEPLIKMESADNVYTIWQSNRTGTDDYLVGIDGGNNNFQISNITTGAHPFTIKADKVGINNINPSANLDIVGNMALVDGNQGDGKVLTSDINGIASWQAIPNQSDADFYVVGSTTQPTSINDAMYHLGILGLGINNPNSNDMLSVKNISTDNNRHAAINTLMQGTGSGFHYGIYNRVGGTGTGTQFGIYTSISNSGDGSHYASYSDITGDGAGAHTGTFTRIAGSGDGVLYGAHTMITNTGAGTHYGSYIALNNNDTNARQFGQFTDVSGNSGTGIKYGYYANLYNSGTGSGYGSYNILGGATDGNQYGYYANIDASGSGAHYGSYSYLSGDGIGPKYGSRSIISPSAGGAHYAIYGEATKDANNVYAGYFVGDVQINQGKLLGEDSGDADMKAYAYGQIQTSATVASIMTNNSSTGFTVQKLAGTGIYRINFTDTTLANYIVVANQFYYPGFITYRRETGYFDVYVYDTSGNLSDASFSFVVYKK